MHGAALVAIAGSPNITALNKASGKLSHYIVNQDRHVIVKCCSAPRSDTCIHVFSFDYADRQRIVDASPRGRVFVVLVCGTVVITAVPGDELLTMVDVTSRASTTVTVTVDPGKRLRVSSRFKDLPPIARKAFPSMVLASHRSRPDQGVSRPRAGAEKSRRSVRR